MELERQDKAGKQYCRKAILWHSFSPLCFSQGCTVCLQGESTLISPLLVVVLFLEINVPGSQRSQLPITILFGPLLSALPAGYFLFEMGRLIEKDKRGAQSTGTDVIDIDDVVDLEDVIDLQDPTASSSSDHHIETGNPYQPPT
jgi:hypothetical protein